MEGKIEKSVLEAFREETPLSYRFLIIFSPLYRINRIKWREAGAGSDLKKQLSYWMYSYMESITKPVQLPNEREETKEDKEMIRLASQLDQHPNNSAIIQKYLDDLGIDVTN